MTLNASTHGTIGANDVLATLDLTGLHRTAFVPPHPLTLSAACAARLADAFTAIPTLQCSAPANQPAFTLAATIPDTHNPIPSAVHATLAPIPAATIVPLLQTFSLRIPQTLVLGGALSGDLDCDAAPCDPAHLVTSLDFENGTILPAPDAASPILLGDLSLHTQPSNPNRPAIRRSPTPRPSGESFALLLAPATIDLGGRDPASIEARIDLHGLTLNLTGPATSDRLATLAKAIPQFADNLPEALLNPTSSTPIHLDLTATRPWLGPQLWQENNPRPTPAPRTSTRTRR